MAVQVSGCELNLSEGSRRFWRMIGRERKWAAVREKRREAEGDWTGLGVTDGESLRTYQRQANRAAAVI